MLGFLAGGDPAEISSATVMAALASNAQSGATPGGGTSVVGLASTVTPGRTVRLLPPIAGASSAATPAGGLMSSTGRFPGATGRFGSSAADQGSGLGVHAGYVNVVAFEEPSYNSSNLAKRGASGSGLPSGTVRLATADSTGAIYVWQASGGPLAEDPRSGYQLLRELRPAVMRGLPIVSLKFRPALLTASGAAPTNQLLVLAQGQGVGLAGSASMGGPGINSGSSNSSVGVLRTFDLSTYGAMRGFQNVQCGASRIEAVFSPDGRYIACGSEAGLLHLWDAESGAILPAKARVEGGRKAVIGYPQVMYGVAWSPNRHLVATSSFGTAAPVMLVGTILPGQPGQKH